jgi:hypothetical protein
MRVAAREVYEAFLRKHGGIDPVHRIIDRVERS